MCIGGVQLIDDMNLSSRHAWDDARDECHSYSVASLLRGSESASRRLVTFYPFSAERSIIR